MGHKSLESYGGKLRHIHCFHLQAVPLVIIGGSVSVSFDSGTG